MAINPYFKHQREEQDVIEDLTIETIKIHGQNMIYMPRTLVNEDSLFGEDTRSAFNDGYELEMYISSVDGFEGEGDLISRFGLQINDTMKLVVSRKRFEQEITALEEAITAPREGDLLYFPLSGYVFEITFVENENPFYQLGRLYTYQLTCETFKFSKETFSTGWTDIDEKVSDRENPVMVINIGTHSGEFRVGEIVTEGGGGTAEVVSWDTDSNTLEVIGGSNLGSIATGVTGADSNAFGTIGSTGDPATPTEVPTDPFGNNSDIQTEGRGIINFSDQDPFSEGNF
jgi:hypothetical protein